MKPFYHVTSILIQLTFKTSIQQSKINLQYDNMAQKAKKDRAKSNTAALNNLHIGSLVVNALFILFSLLIRRRSFVAYFILSIPAIVAEYVLETSGRPKYDAETKALKSAGEDLAAPGLTEYLFDVVWVTWFAVISVILFGNKGWFVWVVVPAYGAYKGYGLLGLARGLRGAGQSGQLPAEEQVLQGNRRQRRAA